MRTTPESLDRQRPAALRLLDGDAEDLWPTAHRRTHSATCASDASPVSAAADHDLASPSVGGTVLTPDLRVVEPVNVGPVDPVGPVDIDSADRDPAAVSDTEGLLQAAIERANTAEATVCELRAEIQRLNNELVKHAARPRDAAPGPRAATLGASPYAVEAFLRAADDGDIDLEHLLKLVHVLSRKDPELTRAAALATWATADAAKARREAERLKKRLLAYAGHTPPAAAAHSVIADFSDTLTAQSMRALTQRAVETHLDRVEDEYATGGAYIRAQMESDTEAHWADLHGYVPSD